MRIRDEYVIKEIHNVPYLLPYGQGNVLHLPGVQLNETGVVLCERLMGREFSEEECKTILREIASNQDTESDEDAILFLETLKNKNVIVEELWEKTPAQKENHFIIAGIGVSVYAPSSYIAKELELFRVDSLTHTVNRKKVGRVRS